MADLQPGAQTWIDEIAKVFSEISDGETGQVRSYRTAELSEMPAAVTPAMVPCVVHYIVDCQPIYGSGAPTILFWEGRSDFHLTTGVSPANYGRILRYYPRILAAAMANAKLHNTVNAFIIPQRSGAMRFVTYKDPDGKDSHQGIEVIWAVKQDVTGSYTISA